MPNNQEAGTHSRSRFEMVFVHPIPQRNDKTTKIPVSVEEGEGHLGNSQNNLVTPPHRQQGHKSRLIAYLFPTTLGRNIHPSTGRKEIKRSLSSSVPKSFAPYTSSNVSIEIVRNLQVSGMVRQGNEVPNVMPLPLLSNILLDRVRSWKTDW